MGTRKRAREPGAIRKLTDAQSVLCDVSALWKEKNIRVTSVPTVHREQWVILAVNVTQLIPMLALVERAQKPRTTCLIATNPDEENPQATNR